MKQEWFTKIPVLETVNYRIRGMTIDDAENLFQFMSDRETMKFITPNPVVTIEEMRESIVQSINHFSLKKEIPWVVVHKKNEEVIGMFRFHKLHLWHRKTEMGAVIKKEYQQSGVMTEILETILPFGFESMNLNRIVGDIFAGNEGSEKLLTKFGFHKDGVLRQTDFDGERFHDTVVYSMLKEEYEKRFEKEKITVELLKRAIESGWSIYTSSKWSIENPAAGQCGVTALIVQDYLRGEIAKTNLQNGWHFYNIIDGERFDFTESQFKTPITYDDIRSTREEAFLDTNEEQYAYLRKAVKTFLK